MLALCAAGCSSRAAEHAGPRAAAGSEQPPSARAVARVELAAATDGGVDLPGRPPVPDERRWEGEARLLRSDPMATAARERLGSPVPAEEVDVQREGRSVRVRVSAPSPQLATARCKALLAAWLEEIDVSQDATDWLEQRRDRLLRELRELDRSLERVPHEPMLLGAESPDAARHLARKHVDRLRDAPVEQLADDPLASLASIGERRRRLAAELAELRTQYGERHPELQQRQAELEALDEWLGRQRDAEVRALGLFLELLGEERARDRGEPHRWAVLRLWDERLEAESLSVTEPLGSHMPAPLRVLSFEHALARVERAGLSARYGERHPERIALEQRLAAAAAQFDERAEQAREEVAAHRESLQERAARPGAAGSQTEQVFQDVRLTRRRRQNEALVTMIALIEERLQSRSSGAAPKVLEDCASRAR